MFHSTWHENIMIEGLHFDFTAEQLRKHLSTKIDHHVRRAKFYRQSADALEKGGVKGAATPDFSNRVGADPVQSLRNSMEHHQKKVELFTLFRDHMIDQTYRLSPDELSVLELISESRW